MKKFGQHIIRIKLFIGVLWLMLRNNTVTAQQIKLQPYVRCYKGGIESFVNLKADIAFSHQIDFKDPASQITTFQLGVNNDWETHGFATDYSIKEKQWHMGGFLRLFPYDGEKITFMTEFKYMLPVQKNSGYESFSLSSGIILSNHHSFGVELFETIATDLTEPSGISFYTGVRVHFYSFSSLWRRRKITF